ncbi:MAG: RsmB/NOP family class I SAM-dependent RNA methyltransferase [Archaeoglobaceae archaeon]
MSARPDGGIVNQEVAARVLKEVEEKGVSVKTALSRLKIEDYKIRSSVHAYAMETVKRLNAIDYILSKASHNFEELDSFTRNLLRVAVYEMKFKGVHPALATDSAVRIAKKFGKAKLVNAILRRAEDVEIDFESLGEVERLAFEHFHPEWFVRYAMDLLGEEAIELLRANNDVPTTYIRVNELKASIESVVGYLEKNGVELRETFLDEVFEVVSFEKHPAALEWHSKGKYVIQDLASCYVSHVLNPEPGDTVLDLAAAPGIKTSHMAAMMMNEGKIVAVDISEERVRRMRAKLKQLGVKNVEVRLADGCRIRVDADKALADVPCSSTGSIHLHPNVKWSFDAAKFESTLRVQRRLLLNALRCAEEVVYSTCSIMVEENEMQVSGFDVVRVDSPFSRGIREFRGFKFEDWDKVVRSFPHRHRTAGFFIAKLRGDTMRR